MATTPNRNYELPDGGNQLKDDVIKVISAFTKIDADVQSLVGALSAKANSENSTLLGTPTAPTATAGDNSSKVATTAFVATAVSNLASSSAEILATLTALSVALGDDPDFATTVTTQISLKADNTALKSMGRRDLTISSSNPTSGDGADGDVWFKV